MKRCFPVMLMLLLTLLLAACSTNGLYHFTVITEGEHVIDHNREGDLVVLGGKAVIPAGTILDGSAHLITGSLVLAGEISEDVSFLNGDLTLQPTARIKGDLNLSGGSYHPSPGAVIDGQVNTGVSLPDLPERKAPGVWVLLLRALVNGSLLGFAATLMVRYVPNAVFRVSRAAVHHSLTSAAMGLLVGIVGVSLLVTMAYTILLIPVTLLGLFVIGLAVLYGLVGLGASFGRLGSRILQRPITSSHSAFFGTFVFMIIMELAVSIPKVGGLIGLLFALIGLGAVFLTRFGLRPFVPALETPLSD